MTMHGRSGVVAALRACAMRVEEHGAVSWRVALRGALRGPPVWASADITDDWLSIERDLAVATHDPWTLLCDNRRRAGNAALVLSARDGSLHLRADVPLDDVPLDDDSDLVRRVRDACAGIAGTTAEPAHPTAPAVPPAPFAERMREAGWAPLEQPQGRTTVELEVPGDYLRASVDAAAAHLCLAVDLVASAEPLAEPARTAVAHLLLRTAAAVRLVRPVARQSGADNAAGFDVVWTGAPSVGEIAHALCALSVACRLCGREADALQRDADLARRYLEIEAQEMEPITNRPVAAGAAG